MCGTKAFHHFPLLPPQLGARMWEMTVAPRTVEVRILYKSYVGRIGGNHSPISSTLVPAPLQPVEKRETMGCINKPSLRSLQMLVLNRAMFGRIWISI
ncbi:hypothetical protein BU25DRAFT_473953 [Macroventuria anomochaeta]|uniref:Uncharacterized protein n=1 Tax=Macroventuria anomochaeta TaxID=301207 RepID=A0ACB6RTQ2_9PLEO|nr:uncharacterized protein BU25DRAFT_473953 [Macroventuria anomochaeta]KAF2625365.1 hypothetical protein BU25DRAFT_473953 [Macroventuria anomochaeta]